MAGILRKIKTISRGSETSEEESSNVESQETPKGDDPVNEKKEDKTSSKGDQDSEQPVADDEGSIGATSGMGEKISRTASLFKNKTKNLVTALGKKAPRIAETVTEKTKKLAAVVTEKTGEAVAISKLRIKIHNLKNSVEQAKSELGGRTYELRNENRADIYEDDAVKALMVRIKSLSGEIAAVQKEIEAMR